jgi:hypothetical protein
VCKYLAEASVTIRLSRRKRSLILVLRCPDENRMTKGRLGMAKPKRTIQQRRGTLSEAAFAKAVADAGHIFHPSSHDGDFGVDARVEIVRADEVTGIEFGAQVKTKRRGATGIAVGFKTSTVVYWTSRITPTLIAVYDDEADRFHVAWVHRLFTNGVVAPAIQAGRRSIKVTLDPEVCIALPDGWTRVEEEAAERHAAVERFFDDVHLDGAVREFYCRCADAADLLVDFVSWLAFAPTTDLVQTLGLPGRIRMPEPLRPPRSEKDNNREAILVWVLDGMTGVVSDFIREAFDAGNTAEHPLVRTIGTLGVFLQYFRSRAYEEPDGAYDGAVMWRLAERHSLAFYSGLALLAIRDTQRQLRRWFFPRETMHAEAPKVHTFEQPSWPFVIAKQAEDFVTLMSLDWAAFEAWAATQKGVFDGSRGE